MSSCCLCWGIVSIRVLTTCMCGCLNSTGVISVSSNESTGEMLAWNTSTVSFDCPNFKSSAGSPFVFSDSMHVSSVSW